uniref:CSON002158 protein n=1 Tax=Culicoides sonorensis TaxID=179676 RepID=A0A336MJS1_CULSO
MASVRIPEQKIILCGEYGVGKSSIFRRYATNTFTTATDRASTLGLDHIEKTYTLNEREIKLQLWDTGGMERIASVTSSYYKFAEAAILVFALDNESSFHSLSQHLLECVTYAENAKIWLVGNKVDLENDSAEVTDSDISMFCEQCNGLIHGVFKISCKTGEGIDEMFEHIAATLVETNRSRIELQALETHGFKVDEYPEDNIESGCLC